MASEVELVNAALTMLGDESIISLDENSDRARAASRLLASARDPVFREYPWPCLKDRATLARLADNPAFGYAYQYQLPPNCMYVITTQEFQDDPEAIYEIEGDRLLTDKGTAKAVYILKNPDVNKWDASLFNAVASRLAALLTYAITEKEGMRESMWKLHTFFMAQARGVASRESRPPKGNQAHENPLAAVRV